jgi:hypothetical protein
MPTEASRPCSLDLQVHGPAQFDRADRDGCAARHAQAVRQHRDHLGGAGRLAVGVQLERAHLLRAAGRVDLQQEAAAHLEQAGVDQQRAAERRGVAHLQAAVDAAGDDPQRAGHGQRLEDRQVEHRGGAQFHAGVGNDDAEVALQVQRAIQQFEVAVAHQGHVLAGPVRLARRRGRDGEGVEVDLVAEFGGDVVDDVLFQRVDHQVEVGVELGEVAQVDAGAHLHAQGDAVADRQQAGGMRLQHEAAAADAHVDVGEGRDADVLVGREVDHAVHVDQPEQVELDLARDAQELAGVGQDDRLFRIAGRDRVAGLLHVGRARLGPVALREVDRGERRAHRHVGVVAHRAGVGVFRELADAQREAGAGVDVQRHVRCLHGHAGHADQADHVDAGLRRQVDADVDAFRRDHQFLGDDDADVQVLDGQADGAGVRVVGGGDAVVAVGVAPVAAHADEAEGVVDADRQAGDGGLGAVGQGDLLRALLGEGHRGGQLDEAGQVDLRVADLGLHDLLVEVDDHGVVAAGRQRQALDVDHAVVVEVFLGGQDAVVVLVLGEVGEARLVVDRRRAEQLQDAVADRAQRGHHEGVDVDFDVVRLDGQQVLVDADQAGGADGRLGRDELGRVLLHARDRRGERRRHDRQAEVHVVQHQAHRALVDLVGQQVEVGTVRAVAVRAADAGKAGQVGAGQRQRGDAQRQRVRDGNAESAVQAFDQRAQAAQVHHHVVFLALAEGERTTQVQEFGDLDLGHADVDADDLGAGEVQVDRVAAGLHRVPHRVAGVGGGEAGSEVRGGAHQPACRLAAGVHVDRDVFRAQLEHVTEAVGGQAVRVRLEREELLRVDHLGEAALGLHHRQRDVQVLHAEAGQVVLLRERPREVRAAGADEQVDVGGAEAHALELDVVHARVVAGDADDALDAVQDGVGRRAEQRLHQRQFRRQAGVHRAGEALAEIQLEVAVQVDEVAEFQRQVRQFDRAEQRQVEVRVEADRDVEVLREVQRALQEVQAGEVDVRQVAERGQAQARQEAGDVEVRQVQVGQAGQAGHAQVGQRQAQVRQPRQVRHHEGEVERGQRQREQVEHADLGFHADAQHRFALVEGVAQAGGPDGDRQAATRLLAPVDVDRQRVVGDHAGVELQHQVVRFEREERVGADQACEIGGRFQGEEADAVDVDAGRDRRRDHRQGEVEVVDLQADLVAADVDAGERIDVQAHHHERFARHGGFEAEQVVGDAGQVAALEGEAAFQFHQAGDLRRRVADRGLDDLVVEVQQHRRAAGFHLVAVGVRGVGEVDADAGLAAVADADADVVERELDDVAEADEADALAVRLQRREFGALRDQGIQRVEHRLEHRQAEVEIQHREADGVGVHHPVAEVVLGPVRAADADEGLDVVAAELHARGLHVLELDAQRAIDGELGGRAAAEGEVAGEEHELRDGEHGVGDARLDHAFGELQGDGVATGGDQQACRAEALDEIDDRGDVVHALPAAAPVDVDGDVVAFQLEVVAAAGHQELVGRGAERGEARQLDASSTSASSRPGRGRRRPAPGRTRRPGP